MRLASKLLASLIIFSAGVLLGIQTQTAKQTLKNDKNMGDAQCPYYVNSNFDLANNEVNISYSPYLLEQNEISFTPTKFDSDAKNINGELIYVVNGEKQISIQDIDIEGDGIIEKIVSLSTAMNHTPHVAQIVKNGMVIFEVSGAQTYIFDLSSDAFKVHKTVDWNSGEEEITKYKYVEGKIFPIWRQKLCNVRVKTN